MRAAGALEWSDDVEAVSAMLSAAGVLDLAAAQRRLLARSIVGRRFTASDVLTFLLHHLQRGRGGGWLCVALRTDPEAVGNARCKRRGIVGAIAQIAGVVDRKRAWQVAQLIECVAARASLELANAHRYVDDASHHWLIRKPNKISIARDAIGERLAAAVEVAEVVTTIGASERNERLGPSDTGTEVVERPLLRRDLGDDGRGSATEQPREQIATGEHAPSLPWLRERFDALVREGRSLKEASDAVVRLAAAMMRPKMAPSVVGKRRHRLRLA